MILREYNTATTVLFPLITAGGTDFDATPVTFAAGDCQISKDEGAFANTTNLPAHEGKGIYSLALTATEMSAARVAVVIVDAATKAWEDQAVMIETYADAAGAASQHGFLLGSNAPAVDVTTLDGDATAATSLKNLIVLTGSVNDVAPAVGDFDGNAGLSATDDFYAGMSLLFTSGTLAGLSRVVASYDGTSKNLTFTRAWPVAPANSDTFTFHAVEVALGIGAD